MKKILLGLVIGALVTTFLFIKFQPRPGPAKVIENPTKAQEQKADVIIEKKQTEVTSRVPVKPAEKEPEKENVLALHIGDKFTAPANGEIKTIYQDKSGKQIGEGTHKVTGETSVTVGKEYLDISTRFQESVIVAVDVPDPSKKVWHAGLYVYAMMDGLGLGGYTQRDFKLTTIKNIDLVGFGRVEIDRESKLLFGVEGNF